MRGQCVQSVPCNPLTVTLVRPTGRPWRSHGYLPRPTFQGRIDVLGLVVLWGGDAMETETRMAAGAALARRRPRWWMLVPGLPAILLIAVLALGFWPVAPDQPRGSFESRPGPQPGAAPAPAGSSAPPTVRVAPGGSI